LKAITSKSAKHQIVKTMLHIGGFLADRAGSTYWREIARALKKLYLHILVKQPIPKDFLVAIIGSSGHDIEEWRAILGPDVFPYREATLKDLIKSIPSGNRPSPKLWYALRRAAEKNNVVPSYCCKAVDQFFELVKEDMLLYYCPAHEKFFWTKCPICRLYFGIDDKELVELTEIENEAKNLIEECLEKFESKEKFLTYVSLIIKKQIESTPYNTKELNNITKHFTHLISLLKEKKFLDKEIYLLFSNFWDYVISDLEDEARRCTSILQELSKKLHKKACEFCVVQEEKIFDEVSKK